MDFRLTRIVLIDSYCRSRIAELDISGHITINGENGAGKTTLLRLLPMFFGESPSRIIRGDAVTERFGRYYFPTTASYVIFEYQRRTHKVLAVIHPDGQSGDGVVYRFVESEFKPELFMDGGLVVQSGNLYRHLDKLNVYDSKPLTLHSYRQIIQNTAGREHRNLAARFSFVGGKGKLTHLERIVTGILQRATTFYDLRRMIVSSVLSGEDTFALRTGKKDLQHWINEYTAHRDLMEKAPLMRELDLADHHRSTIEAEFSRLHALFKMLQEKFQSQVLSAEKAEAEAKKDLANTEDAYRLRLQAVSDRKTTAASRVKQARQEVELLDRRKRQYDSDGADGKRLKVDSLRAWEDEQAPLRRRLEELEQEVRSVSEVFLAMENEAKVLASELKSELDKQRIAVYEKSSKLREDLSESHKNALASIRARQTPELEQAASNVDALRLMEAALVAESKNVQAEASILAALEADRGVQLHANVDLTGLHDKTDALQKTYDKAKREFDDLELQVNGGELAIEKAQAELEELLVADNASEDTFLGFLRRNKPNWVADIGRLVPAEILLRTDLSPSLSEGSDLYGVSVDLAQLRAGKFSSEEAILNEIRLVRARLVKRGDEVAEDRKALAKKKLEMDAAKSAIDAHGAAIIVAKQKKSLADGKVVAALQRVEDSKRNAALKVQRQLEECRSQLTAATKTLGELRRTHQDEVTQAERLHSEALAQMKADETASLQHLATRTMQADSDLKAKLEEIQKERDASLISKGVSPALMNSTREQIKQLDEKIREAKDLRSYVGQYREWLEASWSQRPAKEQELLEATGEEGVLQREIDALLLERKLIIDQKQQAIVDAGKQVNANVALRIRSENQVRELTSWPVDEEVIAAGLDQETSVDVLITERKELDNALSGHRETIRLGVEDLRRQMVSVVDTGPEKFFVTAQREIGIPRPGREHEWLEIFRNWFSTGYKSNEISLLQLGKTMAQNISYFWKSLDDFKQSVTTFATDLKSNLQQGRIFDTIEDVGVEIKAHVETQNYWEAVGNLHREYEAWHTAGDPSLPPASFVSAAKAVAAVVGEEKGLVADPVDLISLKVSANVNSQGLKTASNEHELANMSSNGLSYIILCVILIGFVNRIRRSEPVVVPFVVDELKDLSFPNAKTLLELLTRNNITMISAFPDIDLDLAELFDRNYKILPGRMVGLVNLDEEDEGVVEEEISHV